MPEKKYKLCYPQLGNYDIPIQYFVIMVCIWNIWPRLP